MCTESYTLVDGVVLQIMYFQGSEVMTQGSWTPAFIKFIFVAKGRHLKESLVLSKLPLKQRCRSRPFWLEPDPVFLVGLRLLLQFLL